MMTLSSMRHYFESGVSHADNDIIDNILNKWGNDKATVEFIRASNNFIFKFAKDKNKYVLRLTDVKKSSRSNIQTELNYLKFLHENNLCVNIPLNSLLGNEIEICNTPAGSFYTVVLNFFEGNVYDIEELDELRFALWGEELGRLHKLASAYQKVDRISLTDQLDLVKSFLDKKEYYAYKELETITDWICSLKKTDENYGLLHCDFELDNLIWNKDWVQIIDFESCKYGWYAADIAFALRDLFEIDPSLTSKAFHSFIEGYRRKMNSCQLDLKDIPMFLRFHNLITFITLQQTMDIDKHDLDTCPQWVKDLNHKLERKSNQYRETFKSYY